MKTNYPTKKLGEVCKIVGGGTPKTNILKYWGGDLCWVTPKDLGKIDHFEISETSRKITKEGLKNSSAQELPIGSVILSSRAPIGYVAINTVPMATNQGCRSFICGPEIFNKYLYNFLVLNTELLNSLGSGSTFLEVSGSRLKEIEIPLPPLADQERIVARIEEQFAKIDEAMRLREETIERTAALLPSALLESFSQAKTKGWTLKELGEVCKINPPKNETKDVSNDTKIAFVPMSAVNEHMQNVEFQESRTFEEVKKGYTYFMKGDILFAKITPCMENGKVAHTNNLNHDIGFGSTEFHVLRADETKVLPRLAYHVVRSKVFRKKAEQRMTGSAGQKRVPKEFLESFMIPLPPLAEQKAIVKRLDALSAKVSDLQELQASQLEDFKALKQLILREAFST